MMKKSFYELEAGLMKKFLSM